MYVEKCTKDVGYLYCFWWERKRYFLYCSVIMSWEMCTTNITLLETSSQIHSPWLGGIKLTLRHGLSYRPPGYRGWKAGTTTPCRIQLYKPVRDYEFGGLSVTEYTYNTELEILKGLWGLGTEEEEGYRTGPPGYIGWRNSFLGINSGAPYT